jgi:hypothetical protein
LWKSNSRNLKGPLNPPECKFNIDIHLSALQFQRNNQK